ncbi:hypothetical protein F5887DRAFT_966871 [Amanita rubescens]|nr:hypothetical protein F5887DRAFT_966871 [Amanita rubescens]
MSFLLREPPTKDSIRDARNALHLTRREIAQLTTQIDTADAALAVLIHDSKKNINSLIAHRAHLEATELRTLAYLSPIRKLPSELLRDIFISNFDEYPCCAWVLAAVCSSWRRLVLQTPKLWSKIRLVTTQQSSADTIRLWLERSGSSVPLDIEIFLRVATPKNQDSSLTRRRRSASPTSGPPTWSIPVSTHNGVTTHYVVIQSVHASSTGITILPPAHTPIVLPPSPTMSDSWSTSSRSSDERPSQANTPRTSMHWGYIAVFYLVEQMHRWERFVFRFDKYFASMSALKSINGEAPLLKEFEVSSAEPAYYADWPWLPNGNSTTPHTVPNLKSLTLQYAPFKWSSPMLHANLETLNLRALPTAHLPLDRILYILSNNPLLRSLTLHFQGVLSAVLPLSNVTLPHLTKLDIGGHYLLTQIIDSLTLPSLTDFTVDIEARDSIEENIIGLVMRSHYPHVEHLSIAYGSSSSASTYYFGPGGVMISWNTLFGEMAHLKSLHIGGTPLEPLLTALGPPGDDMHQLEAWACPGLEVLGMRNCNAHSEWAVRLVQMVEARNPLNGSSSLALSSSSAAGTTTNGGGGGSGTAGPSSALAGDTTPVRLKTLEMHDCTSLGQDVIKWLKDRIENVICTDLTYER